MDTIMVMGLFDRDPMTGASIFHEIAAAGSLILLDRVSEFVDETNRFLLLGKTFAGEGCTHLAARHDVKIAKSLLEKFVKLGVDLNADNAGTGNTVLHQEVLKKNYELVSWLCQQPSIKLETRNYIGLTALEIAYKLYDQEMIKILRNAGAQKTFNCKTDSDDGWNLIDISESLTIDDLFLDLESKCDIAYGV